MAPDVLESHANPLIFQKVFERVYLIAPTEVLHNMVPLPSGTGVSFVVLFPLGVSVTDDALGSAIAEGRRWRLNGPIIANTQGDEAQNGPISLRISGPIRIRSVQTS